ncbi:MAG: OB-fold nucleic acid binding domain-containing protein [Planctomycetota bacterium]|nr:OB-fold nucleic acid binding domain-containing protein [Planctomycetota bacterium]MEE2990102.1 OB-fold nucleic acid binding domain-containing protein [Planctomycetota bacterium]
MTRRFINELGENEALDQVFRVQSKRLRSNRNGNPYLQMDLADRTGAVNAMLWNANQQLHDSFESGGYLQVKGKTQFFNGSMQIIVSELEPVDAETIDTADYFPLTSQKVDELFEKLRQILSGLSNPSLCQLAEAYLLDAQLVEKIQRAPAAMKNHHAYHGGLLEHIVSLLELVTRVAPHYDELDQDLLLMGAFLHDLAKVDELVYETELGYSDEGELVGHLVMGVVTLEEKARQAAEPSGEPFPPVLLLRLKHMIVSHHGRLDYGSPKVPMTPEAIALHFLDDLDAKLQAFRQATAMDAGNNPGWTNYVPALGRKLYRTGAAGSGDEEAAQ